MTTSHEQLFRVLQLARHSPYEGERAKALGVLLERLKYSGLTLQDIDPTIDGESETDLRKMAGHPYTYEVVLRSSEEAHLYTGILSKIIPGRAAVIWLESHRLQCRATHKQRDEAAQLMEKLLPQLQCKLVLAQQQATREYQERKRVLFQGAIEKVLDGIQ